MFAKTLGLAALALFAIAPLATATVPLPDAGCAVGPRTTPVESPLQTAQHALDHAAACARSTEDARLGCATRPHTQPYDGPLTGVQQLLDGIAACQYHTDGAPLGVQLVPYVPSPAVALPVVLPAHTVPKLQLVPSLDGLASGAAAQVLGFAEPQPL